MSTQLAAPNVLHQYAMSSIGKQRSPDIQLLEVVA